MDFNGIDLSKLNPKQRERFEKLQDKIKLLESRTAKILATGNKQKRADETRRAIVLGKLLETASASDKRAKQMLESLLSGVAENMQYLFPEKWPGAVRPSGRKGKGSDGQEEVA